MARTGLGRSSRFLVAARGRRRRRRAAAAIRVQSGASAAKLLLLLLRNGDVRCSGSQQPPTNEVAKKAGTRSANPSLVHSSSRSAAVGMTAGLSMTLISARLSRVRGGRDHIVMLSIADEVLY